mmetsp:Transcript_8650/g.14643  ORF Transcript_8650/g.14643 Transcript_8650/m.14643 type:complete len:240 (-) Transcript_8650:1579-2298(-)
MLMVNLLMLVTSVSTSDSMLEIFEIISNTNFGFSACSLLTRWPEELKKNTDRSRCTAGLGISNNSRMSSQIMPSLLETYRGTRALCMDMLRKNAEQNSCACSYRLVPTELDRYRCNRWNTLQSSRKPVTLLTPDMAHRVTKRLPRDTGWSSRSFCRMPCTTPRVISWGFEARISWMEYASNESTLLRVANMRSLRGSTRSRWSMLATLRSRLLTMCDPLRGLTALVAALSLCVAKAPIA